MSGHPVVSFAGVVHLCTGPASPGEGCAAYEVTAERYRATYEAARAASAAVLEAQAAAATAEDAWLAACADLEAMQRGPGIPACWPAPASVKLQLCEEIDGPGPEWLREVSDEAQL